MLGSESKRTSRLMNVLSVYVCTEAAVLVLFGIGTAFIHSLTTFLLVLMLCGVPPLPFIVVLLMGSESKTPSRLLNALCIAVWTEAAVGVCLGLYSALTVPSITVFLGLMMCAVVFPVPIIVVLLIGWQHFDRNRRERGVVTFVVSLIVLSAYLTMTGPVAIEENRRQHENNSNLPQPGR